MNPSSLQGKKAQSKPALGKKPQLTQKQLKPMRMVLQKVEIPGKGTYFFNLLTKQSGTGFFSNQRFFILHAEEKCLKYLSNIPQGYLPFQSLEQIQANKQKQKVMLGEASNLKCTPVQGKISSFKMEWTDQKTKKNFVWLLSAGSSKQMNDWVKLINAVKDGTFSADSFGAGKTGPGISAGNKPNTTNDFAKDNGNIESNPNPYSGPSSNKPFQPFEQQAPVVYNNPHFDQSPSNMSNRIMDADAENKSHNDSRQPQEQQGQPQGQQGQPQWQQGQPQGQPLGQQGQQEQQGQQGQHNNSNFIVENNNNPNSYGNNNSYDENSFNHHNNNIINSSNNQNSNKNNNSLVNNNNNSYLSRGSSTGSKMGSYHPGAVGSQLQRQQQQQSHLMQSNAILTADGPQLPPQLPLSQPYQQPVDEQQRSFNRSNTSSLNPTDFVQELKRMQRKNPSKFKNKNELSTKKLDAYNPQQLANPTFNQPTPTPTPNFTKPVGVGVGFNPTESATASQKNIRHDPEPQSPPRSLSPSLSQKFLNRENSVEKRKQFDLQSGGGNRDFHDRGSHARDYSRVDPQHTINNASHNHDRPTSNANNNSSYNNNKQHQYQSGDKTSSMYHPSANFPESSKNLNKIRSDYLEKRSGGRGAGQGKYEYAYGDNDDDQNDNVNPLHPEKHRQNDGQRSYPHTAKYGGRLLGQSKANSTEFIVRDRPNDGNNRRQQYGGVEERGIEGEFEQSVVVENNPRSQHSNSRNNFMHKDQRSTSSLHPSSIHPNPLSHPTSQHLHPLWNQTWLQTSNPNKKIEIYEQFITRTKSIVQQITEDLPLPRSNRKYQPYQSHGNYHTYMQDGIEITLHVFQNIDSTNGSQENIDPNAHVLYDQESYEELKREFYNYNLVLSVTANQGFVKVPLCTLLEYKGVLALCKAKVPDHYYEINSLSQSCKEQFGMLEEAMKVRFIFGTYNVYGNNGGNDRHGQDSSHSHSRSSIPGFVLLYNLKNLIPAIPNTLNNQNGYFRKEFLLQYDDILQDLETSSQAHSYTVKHTMPQLLMRLQSLDTHIVHTKDLSKEFHRVGLSLSYLPQIAELTTSHYLRKIFKSEIVINIFTDIARSELNHAFMIMPAENLGLPGNQLNSLIIDCMYVLVEHMFGYSQNTQMLWKMIVQEAMKRYRVMVSKEDTIPGYLLSGIVYKLGLKVDFKNPRFDKNKPFYVDTGGQNLPRECMLGFEFSIIRRYDMELICPTYSKVKQLIQQDPPTQDNFQALVTILNLKSASKRQLPEYYGPIREQLKAYLCNYIIYGQELQFQNIDAYEYMYQEPRSYNCMRSSLMAIKWLIKKRDIEKADQLLQIQFYESSFWIGECNGPIIEFYDFFSMYYASVGNYKESIILAKSSLENVQKLLGVGALPAADKHYQLGNIFFKIGRKQNSLQQYERTKSILVHHGQTSISEFGIILLKVSLIYLNFGKIGDCVLNAMEAEKIFQSIPGNENEQIECFEILARAYEITKKTTDIHNMCEVCAKIFNNTQNPKILRKMLKIVIYPRLTTLSTQQQKSLTQVLLKLEDQVHNTQNQAFTFLHKKAYNHNLKKKICQFLENIVLLIDQVNRRDLLRKHESLSSRSVAQAEQMLTIFEAVGILVGFQFMIGSMKDSYYE